MTERQGKGIIYIKMFLLSFIPHLLLALVNKPFLPSKLEEKVPILMYHHIRVPPAGAKRLERLLTVTPDDFYKQMEALYKAGYRTISLSELFERKWEKKFIITFDDGYKDVLTEAYLILSHFGFKATIFVIVNEIGKPGHLNWWDIKFSESQGWEIGSHTMSHLNLTHLSPSQHWKEIYESKRKLEERLGHPIYFISYPQGKFNEQVI
ncbi:polysaccharide deacetylase family protein [bacterium]|nr:polysaccharide deacetylase family protein [bacterium]